MRPRLLVYLILLLSVIHLSAQEIREFEFSVYGQYRITGVEYTPVDSIAIAAGEKIVPPETIETHSLARMGTYSFRGGSDVTFVSRTNQETVAEVKVPLKSNKWLFIFVRNPLHLNDPENQFKYLVYPFDDSSKNLPRDQLVFLNLSGKELEGSLEAKRVKVNVGESEAIKVQKSMPISLWTRDFRGERLLPALIKTYQFEANHRYLMIFFPPVLRGSADLDVRFLSEKTP
jgi:hypothetical protein